MSVSGLADEPPDDGAESASATASARVVAALRKRADALDAEAGELDVPDDLVMRNTVFTLRTIAEEFRGLAGELAGQEPG